MYFQEQEKKYKKVAGNGRESISPLSRANILRPPRTARLAEDSGYFLLSLSRKPKPSTVSSLPQPEAGQRLLPVLKGNIGRLQKTQTSNWRIRKASANCFRASSSFPASRYKLPMASCTDACTDRRPYERAKATAFP